MKHDRIDTHIHDGPLIIGAGLAGLNTALHAAPLKVLVLAPTSVGQACASAWAQGGIAAALGKGDSPEAHARDTEMAGAGLVDGRVARLLTSMAPEVVRHLHGLGAPFDQASEGGFALSREAAHSAARVARVGGDLAGKAILEAVAAAAIKAPHIMLWENTVARGLISDDQGRVIGAVVNHDGHIVHILARAVILATGGIGGLYAVTTNPSALRGEGLAMAALAGAVISDPEFVQFHPTAINIGADPAPLATEALRGEGALLVTRDGYRFCLEDHPDGELAPRDIVARAVDRANRELGGAYLDARTAIGAHFPDAFPTVFAACRSAAIDPRTDLIPVAPAAHYHMGGIACDANGHTTIEGLYVVGECAATGVHGANRLASNSLLEAAAFGERLGQTLVGVDLPQARRAGTCLPAPSASLTPPDLQRLRQAMSLYAGVRRNAEGLHRLMELIANLSGPAPALPLVTARLVAKAALNRRESRGSHFRTDFPGLIDPPAHARLIWSKAHMVQAATADLTPA